MNHHALLCPCAADVGKSSSSTQASRIQKQKEEQSLKMVTSDVSHVNEGNGDRLHALPMVIIKEYREKGIFIQWKQTNISF